MATVTSPALTAVVAPTLALSDRPRKRVGFTWQSNYLRDAVEASTGPLKAARAFPVRWSDAAFWEVPAEFWLDHATRKLNRPDPRATQP